MIDDEVEQLKKVLRQITKLAVALRPVVATLEAGPAATKNHYGAYMSMLLTVDAGAMRNAMARALIEAGANNLGNLSSLTVVIQ